MLTFCIICISYHFLTLKWHRSLKSFPTKDKDPFMLSQYPGCRWLDSARNQGINNHGITLIHTEHSNLSTRSIGMILLHYILCLISYTRSMCFDKNKWKNKYPNAEYFSAWTQKQWGHDQRILFHITDIFPSQHRLFPRLRWTQHPVITLHHLMVCCQLAGSPAGQHATFPMLCMGSETGSMETNKSTETIYMYDWNFHYYSFVKNELITMAFVLCCCGLLPSKKCFQT